MRLIDADALRETLGITGTADTCHGCKYNDRYYYCNTDKAPRFSYVCECIDDAPTIDAAPDWHYIEDGMPDEENYYLITWEGITGERYVSIAWYDAEENRFMDTCYKDGYYIVIAYAEAPKPADGR